LLRNLTASDFSFDQSLQVIPQSRLLGGGQRHRNGF